MENQEPNADNLNSGDINTDGFMQDDSAGVLDSGAPTVAAAPGKTLLVVGAFILFLVFVFSLIFSDDEEEVVDNTISEEVTVAMPNALPPVAQSAPLPPPPIPRVSAPPPRLIPAPPPPVPAPPEMFADDSADEALQVRLQSEMSVVTGGILGRLDGDDEPSLVGNDPNSAFGNTNTVVGRRTAKRIGNLNSMIAQGKVIHAVLETAIDAQLPGQLRAIVSRDTYAESGKAKLIPKGSRLIGSYNTELFRGQSRVFIIWTRVIRPDGIDIMIDSPATDALGRSGLKGHVNSRYDEILGAAVLSSVVSLATAVVAEDGLGVDGNQQTANAGGTVSDESPKNTAALQGISTINTAVQGIISDLLDVRQGITVDQGTKVNVMVNKDLIFPDGANKWMIE